MIIYHDLEGDVARPVVSGSVYPGYSKHDFEGDVVEGSTVCTKIVVLNLLSFNMTKSLFDLSSWFRRGALRRVEQR